MQTTRHLTRTYQTIASFALATLAGASALQAAEETGWKAQAIAPVVNPIYFESPLIQSEVRPIFIYDNLDKGSLGGHAQVYAAQIRYAVTEKLAIIATKDGYIDLKPNAIGHSHGWADLAAGVKYALIDDQEKQLTVTPGLKLEIPTGNEAVFQGKGKGEWDVFVSAAKGFGAFQLMASVGSRIPNDFSANTAQLHSSVQASYFTCKYFIPFAAMNTYTTLNSASGPGLNYEGADLINLGSSGGANGYTQVVMGFGFRSRILDNLDLGFGYEKGVTNPKGLIDDRYTVDAIFRF